MYTFQWTVNGPAGHPGVSVVQHAIMERGQDAELAPTHLKPRAVNHVLVMQRIQVFVIYVPAQVRLEHDVIHILESIVSYFEDFYSLKIAATYKNPTISHASIFDIQMRLVIIFLYSTAKDSHIFTVSFYLIKSNDILLFT